MTWEPKAFKKTDSDTKYCLKATLQEIITM